MSETNGNGNGVKVEIAPWMKALGIKKGDYGPLTKAVARRGMTNPCFAPPARLFLALWLHTSPYRSELAVKLDEGKKIPIQPSDICAEAVISLNHFREYMNCLEFHGMGKADGWTKGRFKLYLWLVPRKVEQAEFDNNIVPRAGTIFDGCPPDLATLFAHYRIRFPAGFIPRAGTIEKLAEAARVAYEAEKTLRAVAKEVCARPPLNKEEIEPLLNGRNGGPSSSSGFPAVEDGPPPLPQPHTNGSARPDEVAAVTEAMAQYGTRDPSAARRMIADCRKQAPEATADAICQAIHAKGRKARRAENPNGLLLTSVPPVFEGVAVADLRREPELAADGCMFCRGSGNHPNLIGEPCPDCAGTGQRADAPARTAR